MSAEDIRLTDEDDGKKCHNHHLIVIGNGFDLSCGLASSFKDFFEPRMRAVDSLVSEEGFCDYEAIKARGLTAWDLILRSRKDMEARAFNVNWCDVETAIANVFGINLPEDGIDDEGVMISDYAVSFGSLQDYLYLADEVNTSMQVTISRIGSMKSNGLETASMMAIKGFYRSWALKIQGTRMPQRYIPLYSERALIFWDIGPILGPNVWGAISLVSTLRSLRILRGSCLPSS
ncbi:MAG: AbiH family protein [Collinsella sp.]